MKNLNTKSTIATIVTAAARTARTAAKADTMFYMVSAITNGKESHALRFANNGHFCGWINPCVKSIDGVIEAVFAIADLESPDEIIVKMITTKNGKTSVREVIKF